MSADSFLINIHSLVRSANQLVNIVVNGAIIQGVTPTNRKLVGVAAIAVFLFNSLVYSLTKSHHLSLISPLANNSELIAAHTGNEIAFMGNAS